MAQGMRVILYTGKGGTGKTSISAATAMRCAELGYRTLVMSTDPAHSLSDSMDTPIGPELTPLAERLWGQEVDIDHEMDQHWGTLQEYLRALLSWRGIDEVRADEMAALPGMEELAGLLHLLRYYEEDAFDVAIVDCAPTAETLRLLTFPDVMRWWMRHIFPIERMTSRIVRPLVKRITDIPMPEDEVFKAAESLFSRLDEMHDILVDPEVASVRLVVNPEKMVIREAKRTFTYLNLYSYGTDMVLCNRVVPASAGGYFQAWRQSQSRHLQEIQEGFAPLPILQAPFFEREVVGREMLRRLADALYGGLDPALVHYQGKIHEVRKDDGAYVLSIALPFASRDDVSLMQTGEELVVHVGSQKCHLILPRTLVGLESQSARFKEDRLEVRFAAPAAV